MGSEMCIRDRSADGKVVVGLSDTAGFGQRAFRWTKEGGMVSLGTLGGDSSHAYAVNGDGSVVVGRSTASDGRSQAFIWKASTGMRVLGNLDVTSATSVAQRISDDGTVVIGQRQAGMSWEGFRWTEAGAFQYYIQSFIPYGMSADGSVLVGTTPNGAARWTASSGVTLLGTLGGSMSGGSDISNDGSIIVGRSQDSSGQDRAYYWTAAKGMVNLGTLGGDGSSANGISGDGRFIVGDSSLANGMARGFWMLRP